MLFSYLEEYCFISKSVHCRASSVAISVVGFLYVMGTVNGSEKRILGPGPRGGSHQLHCEKISENLAKFWERSNRCNVINRKPHLKHKIAAIAIIMVAIL